MSDDPNSGGASVVSSTHTSQGGDGRWSGGAQRARRLWVMVSWWAVVLAGCSGSGASGTGSPTPSNSPSGSGAVGLAPVAPDANGLFHLPGPGAYSVVVVYGQCTRATLAGPDRSFVDVVYPETPVDFSAGGAWRVVGYRENPDTHQLFPCSLTSITMRRLASATATPQ